MQIKLFLEDQIVSYSFSWPKSPVFIDTKIEPIDYQALSPSFLEYYGNFHSCIFRDPMIEHIYFEVECDCAPNCQDVSTNSEVSRT